MLRSISCLLTTLAFLSCNNDRQKSISEKEKASLMLLGDSIAVETQNTLLQNVAEAIQKGGTDYAVEFCNVKAIPLTDSVANRLNAYIQRLSDKNRNPANALQTQRDSLAWQKIKSQKADFVEQDNRGDIYYYKPILMAMSTCLKCHGGKTEIAQSTQKIIAQKYPNDKAIGYETGDLRGMWKINIKAKQ